MVSTKILPFSFFYFVGYYIGFYYIEFMSSLSFSWFWKLSSIVCQGGTEFFASGRVSLGTSSSLREFIFFSPLFNCLFLFLYIKIYKLTTFSDYYYKKRAWSTPNSFIRSYQIIIPVYVASTPLATK